tara:strand:+ start:1584 stop:2705 length:1122 start_codon:yes stop_codon:yes gene_type:complete
MIQNIVKTLSIKLKTYLSNYSNKKNIDIYIIKDNELSNTTLFFNYILKDKKTVFLGIDFEFNNLYSEKEGRFTRQVALIQINYNDDFIIMFHPEHLDNNQKIKLKNIFLKDNIIKILHGAESLDIKYLFDKFFDNFYEKKQFLNNFYDTKFMCEYLNLKDKGGVFAKNKKCKIYQLLLKSKLINKKILKKLENNEKNMGPIYDIIVDVNKMSIELIKYTLFDVFYLIKLFKKLNLNKKEHKLINYFLHNTLLYRKVIENDIDLINKFNNSYVLVKEERFTFSFINEYYDGLFNLNNNFNIINDIPYFKKLLTLIIRKSLLNILAIKTNIYQKKNMIINNQVNNLLMKCQFNTNNIYTKEIYNYFIKDIDNILN